MRGKRRRRYGGGSIEGDDRLVDLVVKPGQTVQAGERLAVIEAMKMENVLTANTDGTVAQLLASKGESLAVDQPILSFQ